MLVSQARDGRKARMLTWNPSSLTGYMPLTRAVLFNKSATTGSLPAECLPAIRAERPHARKDMQLSWEDMERCVPGMSSVAVGGKTRMCVEC